MKKAAKRIARIIEALEETDTLTYSGKVTRVVGMTIEGFLPMARIGSVCRVEPPGTTAILAEVVGLRDGVAVMMPLGQLKGITAGTRIVMAASQQTIKVGPDCLGRVLDGLGRPIDELGPLTEVDEFPVSLRPINPLDRRSIMKPLDLGVRAINGLMTCGDGQRIAVESCAGVGKSMLLGMMARYTKADVVIVALIGERGREVQDFVKRDLKLFDIDSNRIIVVAATSDEPAAMRLRGAFTATIMAEYFRDRGNRVLLVMDSLTRVVMAQREIGLSVGEPPATRGYPPSAFAVIPNLLERVGATGQGSITGIYTTLVETEDLQDPIAEAIRATTDGHIVLSRDLAEAGQYPAIDVLKSNSRAMREITADVHLAAAQSFRNTVRDLSAVEDLMSLGAYTPGSNPDYDRALTCAKFLREYLLQTPEECVGLSLSIEELKTLVRTFDSLSSSSADGNIQHSPNQHSPTQTSKMKNTGGYSTARSTSTPPMMDMLHRTRTT